MVRPDRHLALRTWSLAARLTATHANGISARSPVACRIAVGNLTDRLAAAPTMARPAAYRNTGRRTFSGPNDEGAIMRPFGSASLSRRLHALVVALAVSVTVAGVARAQGVALPSFNVG